VQPVANDPVPDISISPDVTHDEAVEAMRQHMVLAAAKVKDGEY
jgi:CBS domain-containing protein